MGKIQLEGMKNTRDLGGIKTAGGRKIKSGKLIKSGMLYSATKEDLEKLTKECDVKTIIDLRTKKECVLMPDPELKSVSNIWNPLYIEDMRTAEIFSVEDRDILENYLKSVYIVSHRADKACDAAIENVRQMVTADDFDPDAYMTRLYRKFVTNQVIQTQMRSFFSILLNDRDGAILFHCAAGKDRTGICAALLLYALGVSKKDIIVDYMVASEASDDAIDELLEKLFPSSVAGNLEYQAMARRIFGVRRCYIEAFFEAIEEEYVNIDNYLQKALQLHVDNLVRLKTLYLD